MNRGPRVGATMTGYYLALAAVLILSVILGVKLHRRTKNLLDLTRNINLYCDLHTRQNLLRASEGVFCLVSIDGGRNWVEFERQPNGEYKLVGPVDLAVIKQLDAREMIFADHNPIDFTNPRHMALLAEAGITVEGHEAR